MALTDIVYKAIAFVVLTPLVGALFRLFVSISGRTVLADEDILRFVLSPVGWGALVVVGGVAIGIMALELSALMTIVCGTTEARRVGALPAVRFTASRALPVLDVAARRLYHHRQARIGEIRARAAEGMSSVERLMVWVAVQTGVHSEVSTSIDES